MPVSVSKPTPRFSLRWKITLPFILLALLLSLGMVYLLSRIVGQDRQERYLLQMTDSGQQAADAVVRIEDELLTTERLIANTEGILDGVQQANSEALRTLVLPLVVNADVDVVSIVDAQASSLLSVRRPPGASAGEYTTLRGEAFYSSWPFVQRLLAGSADTAIGDKQTGMHAIRIGDQDVPVLFVGGPVRDASGVVRGAVLVGRYLEDLVPQVAEQAGASTSIYDQFDGHLLATSLEPQDPAALTLPLETIDRSMAPGTEGDPIRSISVSGIDYTEVLTAFVARHGTEPLGVLGVALPQLSLAERSTQDLWQVIIFGAIALVLVVIAGLIISNNITRPIIAIADASAQVALGNLETRVADRGTDEVAVLARTFNQMVDDLRQRTMVGIVPGETTVASLQAKAPSEVEPAMPTQVVRRRRATILAVELRGLGSLDEAPEVLMRELETCLSMIGEVAGRHSGVLARTGGTTAIAQFGLPPGVLPPAVSALQATHAGMEILDGVRSLNEARVERGMGPLQASVAVATGDVVAGTIQIGKGEPALLGEAMIAVEGMLAIARETDPAVLLISEETHRSLGSAQRQFVFGRFGRAQVRGLPADLGIHEVKDRLSKLVEPGVGEA
ncbi:MAG: HAMP domain-containing protein [Chloroflexi bacterium]|nr:HAMP domain-containing protein [Chloroflexota bacterium]